MSERAGLPGPSQTPPAEEEPEAPDALERRSRTYRVLVDVERVASCVLLVAVLGTVLLQVVTRYVFDNPLSWTEEVARFLLVWLTFVAAGYVMSRRLHIVVDLLVDRLGPRGGRVVDVFAGLVVLVCSGALVVAGAGYAVGSAQLRAPATQLPLTVVYGAAVVGFVLVFAHALLNLTPALREQRRDDPDAAPAGTERSAP